MIHTVKSVHLLLLLRVNTTATAIMMAARMMRARDTPITQQQIHTLFCRQRETRYYKDSSRVRMQHIFNVSAFEP